MALPKQRFLQALMAARPALPHHSSDAPHTPRPGPAPPDSPGTRSRSPATVPRCRCRLHGGLRGQRPWRDKGHKGTNAVRRHAPRGRAPPPRPSNGAARPARPRQARRPLPLPSWGSQRFSSLGATGALLGTPGLQLPLPARQAPSPAPPALTSPAPGTQHEKGASGLGRRL